MPYHICQSQGYISKAFNRCKAASGPTILCKTYQAWDNLRVPAYFRIILRNKDYLHKLHNGQSCNQHNFTRHIFLTEVSDLFTAWPFSLIRLNTSPALRWMLATSECLAPSFARRTWMWGTYSQRKYKRKRRTTEGIFVIAFCRQNSTVLSFWNASETWDLARCWMILMSS